MILFSTFAYYVLGLVYKGGEYMPKKILNLCKRHLQNNFILYFILALALVLGIIIGSIIANRLDRNKCIELANYMNVF